MNATNGVMEVRETMATLKRLIAAAVMVLAAAGAAAAQVSATEVEQIRLRQQMTNMELSLQLAVNNGADMVYAQFKAAFQDRPRFSERPRVSGYRLPDYGPVFTVDVPQFQVPVLFEVLMREAEFRSMMDDLQRMKAQLNGMPVGPQRDRQVAAISQLEQRLGIGSDRRDGFVPAGLAGAVSSLDQKDPDDPMSAYSREVKTALMEAMLNSQGLTIGADEWLTVVARSGVPNNQQAVGDAVETSKGIIRVKGSVLAAFRAGTITKEEALNQFEVKQQ
jgi:hypothetical protein